MTRPWMEHYNVLRQFDTFLQVLLNVAMPASTFLGGKTDNNFQGADM